MIDRVMQAANICNLSKVIWACAFFIIISRWKFRLYGGVKNWHRAVKIPAEKRAILTKNAIFYLPFEFAFWICFFDFREQMDIICKNHRQVLFIAAINSGVRHVRSHSTD